MSSHLLQLSERATQAEGQVFGHAQAGDHIGLSRPVPMLGNGSEGHSNQPLVMEKLGEQIDVKRLYAVVEDNDPIVVMSDFADRSWHVGSLRGTGLEFGRAA
jgi:hypothetical protein